VRYGDLAWAILVCLPVWALILYVIYQITKPRRERSYISRPDGYGLEVNTSQTAIELACEESRRRSRARRMYIDITTDNDRRDIEPTMRQLHDA
jgi:hypothetical protein